LLRLGALVFRLGHWVEREGLQRATTTSVQEIDKLITELQTLSNTLHSERARVQQE
jgi:hypothetical protein